MEDLLINMAVSTVLTLLATKDKKKLIASEKVIKKIRDKADQALITIETLKEAGVKPAE